MGKGWEPESSQGATLTKAAVAGKQYKIGCISAKGTLAGTAVLNFGTTTKWRLRWDANGADGQNFGPDGIKRGTVQNEKVEMIVTGGGTYAVNFTWRYE